MSKKKTGRKRNFSLDKLHKLFVQHEEDFLLEDGKVLCASDPFWSKFKKEYSIPGTEKNIYVDAWKWNKQRESTGGCGKSDFEDTFEDEIGLNSSGSRSFTDDSILRAESDIKFTIKLTKSLWKLIEPVPRSYHRRASKKNKHGVRVYSVLKPGVWSSVIVDQIANHPKNIICDWSFKSARVSNSGKYYVFIRATCVNCQAQLYAYLKTKPDENEEVKFTCVIKGFNENDHVGTTKKVRVSGLQAETLATSKKTAVSLHRKMAAKSGEMFQQPKGRVPSANAIRKLQSRQRQSEQGLSPDIFTSLLYLQASKKYIDTVHMIGISPFFVIFGSNNQFRLYKMYEKRNRLTKISCDATGGVVRKISMYNVQ